MSDDVKVLPAAGVSFGPGGQLPTMIPATMRHDAGAIARCSYCQRYTMDPAALGPERRVPRCDCGRIYGWCGSFMPPGPDAVWSSDHRVLPGNVGITDPPPVPLHEERTCDQHGPTVWVTWTSDDRCPLCLSYESERRLMTEGIGRRIAETAYRLGAKDVRDRAARIAEREPTAPATKGELILRIAGRIHTLDLTRVEPDWTGMARAAMEDASNEAQRRER